METKIFQADTTVRLSCRSGDYLMWVRFRGLVAGERHQFGIQDLWQLKDGNFITITNRREDLPPWFELHPLETSGLLVYWMQKKLKEGHKPSAPVDVPNIWRVFAGDRLAWVGHSRPDMKGDNGILTVFDFRENALVIGTSSEYSMDFEMFGGFDTLSEDHEGVRLCRRGWRAACHLGIPRVIGSDGRWTIG